MNYVKNKARLILLHLPLPAYSPVKLQLARQSFWLNRTHFANTARLQSLKLRWMLLEYQLKPTT
jgi:hypothetical protein